MHKKKYVVHICTYIKHTYTTFIAHYCCYQFLIFLHELLRGTHKHRYSDVVDATVINNILWNIKKLNVEYIVCAQRVVNLFNWSEILCIKEMYR